MPCNATNAEYKSTSMTYFLRTTKSLENGCTAALILCIKEESTNVAI